MIRPETAGLVVRSCLQKRKVGLYSGTCWRQKPRLCLQKKDSTPLGQNKFLVAVKSLWKRVGVLAVDRFAETKANNVCSIKFQLDTTPSGEVPTHLAIAHEHISQFLGGIVYWSITWLEFPSQIDVSKPSAPKALQGDDNHTSPLSPSESLVPPDSS